MASTIFTIAGYGYVGEEEEEEESPSLPNGLRRHSSLSSRPPSSLGMFSQIPEIDSESVQFSHWNDPSSFIDNLSSLKRETENDGKLFHGAQVTILWFSSTKTGLFWFLGLLDITNMHCSWLLEQ